MKMSELKDKGIPYPLIRAVVRQSGGWESFQEMAPDITNHGVNGGFGGWIYYTETVAFWRKNKGMVIDLAESMARDMDIDVIGMITWFNCIKGKYTRDEVAKALYGRYSDEYTTLYNAMAWFAAEETARLYCDARE